MRSSKSSAGWRIKIHEAPCYGSGSSWCRLDYDRIALKKMIDQTKRGEQETPKQKRFYCYRDAISKRWGYLGWQSRKRCRWCFKNVVRCELLNTLFTGFKSGLAD